ncbi:TetR family transcriptional regulator [Skermania sp. ID1734]|uniref:TetR family transcriptional regulator n=1 Tax=Skermania sp. ID1734 TaxID=2597516 RepID=UPI00117FF033|nr:TetR family transcriptional regulator [Skermania sp. ID1734]TSD97266.1 TetR family transcriptional regulator [Skermania sp. ID1734]
MTSAESDRAAVGNRIRNARQAARLSLRETAARLGVSPATLSAIENGKTGASITRLRAVAAALDTTVPALIGEHQSGPSPRARHRADADLGTEPPHHWREFPTLRIDPVLAAAIDAFVETGYHGATMRSIAQRAGMSVPGVYHHYRDKQQLLVRALDLTMSELHWRVRAARRDGTTPIARVALMVEALALYHTHRRKLAFIGASEMRSLTPGNRRRIAKSRSEIQHLLDHDIDAAIARGDLTTDHARIAGRAIATMCTSLPQWFRIDGPVTPEQIAAQYADFALNLLEHKGSSAPNRAM